MTDSIQKQVYDKLKEHLLETSIRAVYDLDAAQSQKYPYAVMTFTPSEVDSSTFGDDTHKLRVVILLYHSNAETLRKLCDTVTVLWHDQTRINELKALNAWMRPTGMGQPHGATTLSKQPAGGLLFFDLEIRYSY